MTTSISMTGTSDNDWYASACATNLELDARSRSRSTISSAWGTITGTENDAQMFHKILDAVRNITRNHGLPRHCKIDFASLSESAAGCAGFRDVPTSFDEPFILLDKAPLELCENTEVLAVYCGLGIHEASHILHTREGFMRLVAGMSEHRRVYDNLWEDERIEALARAESPGYAPILQTTKHALIERPLQTLSGTWDPLPDMDKIEKLVFAFIRCPHRLTDEMKQWTAINHDCAFELLRSMFPSEPLSESDVEEFAIRSESFWQKYRQLYPELPEKFVEMRRTGELDDNMVDRTMIQLEADARDRALLMTEDENCSGVVDRLLKEAERFERTAGIAFTEDRESLLAISDRLLDHACEVEKHGDSRHDRAGNRFSSPEVMKILDTRDGISCPLSDQEIDAIAELADEVEQADSIENFESGDAWDGERKTVVQIPQATEEARQQMELDRTAVRQHKESLRRSIRLAQNRQQRLLTGRTRGRINPRQISRGFIDEHIFCQRMEEESEAGLALCLLLDESGSMFQGDPSRFDRARQVAALFVDALGSVPNIELEVYTHSSCGPETRDCLVRYCFGRRNRDLACIGDAVGGENYDHQAIRTAGELFRRNTSSKRPRWMIVVSDGAPHGVDYGGEPAIKATRDAVIQLRKSGIRVLNIAIEDYASEQIFGDSWVLKFTDMEEFVPQMVRLVKTLLRSTI
ncbi:vWA domain-containing protein [Gimesia maris]|uniref:vWA domain-containing protein n=1 Tax=Gimesia maris TaxID=122 RepID=UPI0032EF610C